MSSDPQDLLYTNQFISTQILNEETIEDNTKFYNRYINHLDGTDPVNTNIYLDNNIRETDSVNINNTLDKHWPIEDNKNNYPLTNTFIQDVSENNYKFNKNIKVLIDSNNRNKNKYPYSTDFSIDLTKLLNNVEKIEFSDFDIPSLTPNINIYSNNIAWEYFSNYYAYNSISFNIIPIPDGAKLFSYYSIRFGYTRIPISILNEEPTFNPGPYLTYQANIQPGQYTTRNLTFTINQTLGLVTHGGSNYSVNPNSKINLDSYGLTSNNYYEEPYLTFKNLKHQSHKWSFDIETNVNTFYAVNRIEEVGISAIQTFSQPLIGKYSKITFQELDPFFQFSNKKEVLDTKLFYIIVPYIKDTTDLWFNNNGSSIYGPGEKYFNPFIPSAFPLVITNLVDVANIQDSKIGGMSKYFISYTSYFDETVYTKNGITDLSTVNYYKYIDTLTIPIGKKNTIYFRFGFSFNPDLARGNSFNNSLRNNRSSNPIPTITESIIYSKSLHEFISIASSLTTKYQVTLTPLIGRALFCRFIYDADNSNYRIYETNEIYMKKTSALQYLGMPIANQTAGLFVSNYNYGFAFVHTTRTYLLLNGNDPYSLTTLSPSIYQLTSPMGIQRSNNGYIVTDAFYYLKITFKNADNNSSFQDELIIANDEYNLTINQNYVNDPNFSTTSIGYSSECTVNSSRLLLSKNRESIMIKLNIGNGAVDGTQSLSVNQSTKTRIYNFYDNPINNLTDISVEILDSKFRKIQSVANLSFIMNFHIKDMKLKNTEINTRNNTINNIQSQDM